MLWSSARAGTETTATLTGVVTRRSPSAVAVRILVSAAAVGAIQTRLVRLVVPAQAAVVMIWVEVQGPQDKATLVGQGHPVTVMQAVEVAAKAAQAALLPAVRVALVERVPIQRCRTLGRPPEVVPSLGTQEAVVAGGTQTVAAWTIPDKGSVVTRTMTAPTGGDWSW
jgi:hypothetical protein